MNNEFRCPYLGKDDFIKYFPYTREKLIERAIFPTYMFDTGAALCANDILKNIPKSVKNTVFFIKKKPPFF